LPANVKGVFQPDKVNLSVSETKLSSQLLLTIPSDTMTGDYPFTVLAVADDGKSKQLSLTLTIESKALISTNITLIPQPMELQFMNKLNLLGQLVIESGKQILLEKMDIEIIFTNPNPDIKPQIFNVKTDSEGRYQTPFTPDTIGKWKVKARFNGNSELKPSERESYFTVIKGKSGIVFDTGTIGALGTEIEITGNLTPQLKGEIISLKVIRPNGSSTLTSIVTEALGIFYNKLKLDMDGAWEITATWAGNAQYEGSTQSMTINVSKEIGKAIIVLGGGSKNDNPYWTTFNRVAEYVHNTFIKRSLDDKNDIYYLSPDPKNTSGADNVTSMISLEYAITDWAGKQVNSKVPLYIYLLSHNLGDQFLLEKHGDQEVYLTPALLDSWLDKLPSETPVVIIIEACHSGNFICTTDGKPTPLVSSERIIITSARADKQAKISQDRMSFSKLFFERITANDTISEAFRSTEILMERIPILKDQFPQMDANGDSKINTPQDYTQVSHLYLPADIISLANPPKITKVTPSQILTKDTNSLKIYAKVTGVNITRVYATVIPPSFDPSIQISDWSELALSAFDLTKDSEGEYSAFYEGFTLLGNYTIIISAENPDGDAEPTTTVITKSSSSLIKGDVNGDGKIGSNDAIMVLRIVAGLQEPTEYQKQAGDMNGDGKLSSNDAILILRRAAGLPAPGRNASRKPITITMQETLTEDGITVLLKADNMRMIAGGDITISYNSSMLNAVEVLSDIDMLFSSTQPGVVRIAFACADGMKDDNIAIVRFEGLQDKIDNSSLSLRHIELYGHDAQPLKVNIRALTIPKRTELYQNYPNPFNPETWIPYQLTIGSEIMLKIYSSEGRLVKVMNLGYKEAGVYITKDRSVYWDGTNESGEKVSSGVYYYSIQTKNYTSVCKMIVIR
jgi:hypothetical protein